MKDEKNIDIVFSMSSGDRRGAGLYYATYPLFQELNGCGYSMSLLSGQCNGNYCDDYSVWGSKQYFRSFKNLFTLKPKIIHIHGLWGWHTLYAFLLAIRSRAKIIISPHGMMDSWAMRQSRFKKILAMIFYERLLWKRASYFHALNLDEKKSILALCPSAKVFIIPNGVDAQNKKKNFLSQARKKRLIFIGRLDRKKGIDQLLSAWNKVYRENINVELHIAGPGDEELIKMVKIAPGIKYHGALYGDDKSKFYQSADAFILPSFSEGLPMTVLEAWSWGVPTFITRHCNLNDEIDSGLSFLIEPSQESIINAITSFGNMCLVDLQPISMRLQQHVRDHYSWPVVARMHMKYYEGEGE